MAHSLGIRAAGLIPGSVGGHFNATSMAIAPQRASKIQKTTFAAPQLAQSKRRVSVHAVDQAAAAEGWWQQDLPENFRHVDTVQELVDELAAGADQLVVVDFFAPWCRACKALFPKLKKLCAENPDVVFLAVNFDENKGLARGLGVKVLPFFHFYRGAEGRVDEFTASVSKVQRLRDAIADHKSDRCILEEFPEHPLPEFPSVIPGGNLGKKNNDNASAKTEVAA